MGQVPEGAEAEQPSVAAVVPGDIEQINLEQALIDFEIANARVVDLAARVTTLSSELLRLRTENGDTKLQLAQARAEADVLRAQNAAMGGSLAYRAARMLGDGRAMLRRR